MATILQFAERLVEDGDWTPAERSQLRDMGAQLGQTVAGLDLVFGKTEEGDPWCVVADDRSEVLLHVARIGGGFVVHAPRNDQVIESHDLWLAVSRVLGGVLRDRRGLILPFAPEVMGQPTVLALMVAAAVRGDFNELAPAVQNALPALASPGERSEAVAAPSVPVPVHGQEAVGEVRHGAPLGAAQPATSTDQHLKAAPAVVALALVAANPADAGAIDAKAPTVHAAADQESAPAARAAPDPGPSPPAAPTQSTDLAVSGQPPSNGAGAAPAAAVAVGGHGAAGFAVGSAHVGGAAGGSVDTAVVGGAATGAAGDSAGAVVGASPAPRAGENAVVVHTDTVAQGQAGTVDVFVLTAPVRTEGSNVISLGVVAGFSVAEGDRLVFANGATPAIVQVIDLNPLSTSASGLTGETVRRIGYDFNGDGVEDAFVVVVDASTPLELHKAAAIETAVLPASDDHSVAIQGLAPAAGSSITVVFIGQ